MTPNSGFKVTGYLKVEYLADGARVFNIVQNIVVDHRGSTENVQKNCVAPSLNFFFAKSAGKCFILLIEIKHNSVSLR